MSNKATDSRKRSAGISQRIVDLSIAAVDDSEARRLLKRYVFSTLLVNQRWVSIGITGVGDDAEVISGDAQDDAINAVLSAVRKALEQEGGFDDVKSIELPSAAQSVEPEGEDQA